jgi:hypothetical protein
MRRRAASDEWGTRRRRQIWEVGADERKRRWETQQRELVAVGGCWAGLTLRGICGRRRTHWMEERGKRRRRGHLQRSLRPCIVDKSCERSVCNCSTSSPSKNVNQRVEYAAVWGG